MSSIRVTNIQAKADASSPTVDEKVKVLDSQGNVVMQVDAKTSGITTVGINTTGNTFTVQNNNVSFAGIVTATGGFSGNLTGNVNSTGVTTFSNIIVTGGTISGVSTAGITTAYIGAINDGPLSGARNIIINGSMVVNQRGFTGAAGTTTTASYVTDRFYIAHSHDGVVSAGQTSMTSGNAYADGFQNALFFNVTTADASLAASQYQLIAQSIEGFNVQGIKKGTPNALPVTLSFWCRSTTTGTYIAELSDNDNSRKVSQAYTINAANTWEKKTLTFPSDTTGAFDNDNNASLYVFWWLAAGSDFTSGTLQTTWANVTANRAVGQTNLLASAGNNFWLTGVQLEVGNVATPFERRSYGQELALCYRYYRKYSSSGSTYTSFGSGLTGGSSSINRWGFSLDIPMRTTPTVAFTNCVGWNGPVGGAISVAVSYTTNNNIDLDLNTSGLNTTVGFMAKVLLLSNGYVELTGAEL